MLRVSFTLFNLQGTRFDLSVKCSTILSHSVSFVKNFFQAFPGLFCPGTAFPQVLSSNRRFRANSFSLAHPLSLVNTFFQDRSCFPPLCPNSRCPPREALRYNTNSRPFCQHLFSLFRRFFRRHLFLIQNSGCALLLNVIGYLI